MEASVPEKTNGYKLLAYNTSFVNDCYDNQFHGFLSESASIIAKMGKLGDKTYNDLITMIQNSYPEYHTLLNSTRTKLAEASTQLVKQKLDEGYDFVALTEQSMHVPLANHANYDEVMMNKLDLTQLTEPKKNEDYGIMKRIATLNASSNSAKINDVSIVDGLKLLTDMQEGSTYNLVYDNVANPDMNAGEGIAIIYKAELVKTHLEWNYQENPAYKNIKTIIQSKDESKRTGEYNSDNALTELSTKKSSITEAARFYSDDLGPYVCKAADGTVIYKKVNGLIDNGRPFIMTGGTNGTTLNLFIAAHGPNVMNLFTVGNEPTSFKELDSGTLSSVFNIVRQSIETCIQNGVTAVTNKDVLKDIANIQVFLGGDFNDPRGLILEKLLNGLKIKIPGHTESFKVNFNYKLVEHNRVDVLKSENKTTEAGYPSLISGCANTDSLIGNVRKIENGTLGPVGVTPNDVTKGIYPLDVKMNGKYTNYTQSEIFKPPTKKNENGEIIPDDTKSSNPVNQLIDRIEYIQDKYPADFISPEKFGYNGDYALFGTNDEINKQTYVMQIPKKDDADSATNYKLQEVTSVNDQNSTVIASDHLPVYSMVYTESAQLGGRRTRRRKTRSHKLRPRKTRKHKSNKKSRKMRRR